MLAIESCDFNTWMNNSYPKLCDLRDLVLNGFIWITFLKALL